jgi:hypothetical protein
MLCISVAVEAIPKDILVNMSFLIEVSYHAEALYGDDFLFDLSTTRPRRGIWRSFSHQIVNRKTEKN